MIQNSTKASNTDVKKYYAKLMPADILDRFIKNLATAEITLVEALRFVEFTRFPEINKDIVNSLRDIIDSISEIENDVSKPPHELLVLTDSDDDLHYYKIVYHRTEYCTISSYIQTTIDISKYSNDNDFLKAVIEKVGYCEDMCDYDCMIKEIDIFEYIQGRK